MSCIHHFQGYDNSVHVTEMALELHAWKYLGGYR